MAIRNHYQTLRLPPTASPEEIKKAFRKLAHQYHPDKNNVVGTHKIFLEIQEAYNTLGDPKKKKQYDEERYFSGLSSRREPASVSTEWILRLATELRLHTDHLYTSDINHLALYDYVMLLLSDSHLAYLEQESDEKKNDEIVKEILQAIKKLEFSFYEKIAIRILEIKPVSSVIPSFIRRELNVRKDGKFFEKWLPLLVMVTVSLLCFFMYLYSRKQ